MNVQSRPPNAQFGQKPSDSPASFPEQKLQDPSSVSVQSTHERGLGTEKGNKIPLS